MPLAATHIIITTSAISRFWPKSLKNGQNTKHFIFFAAFGSLLPDLDIPLGWVLKYFGLVFEHGTVTHTPFFALLFLAIAVLFNASQKKSISQAFFIFFLGILIHLVLDYSLGGGAKEGVAWFYPFSTSAYKIHALFLLPFSNTFEALDAIVLLAWIYIKSPRLLNNRTQ